MICSASLGEISPQLFSNFEIQSEMSKLFIFQLAIKYFMKDFLQNSLTLQKRF